jgi:hypothetical protein
MFARKLPCIIVFNLAAIAAAAAAGVEWQSVAIATTRLRVDVPVSIFTDEGPAPEGAHGRTLFTSDRRADLTIKSVPNSANDSPRAFLKKMRPPPGIQYKRVTADFFAVSSIRNGRTWYNRCNRANGYMNCILINYPASEERQWDAVVTRISLSLAK